MNITYWLKEYQKHKLTIVETLVTAGVILLIISVFVGKLFSTIGDNEDESWSPQPREREYTKDGCLKMSDGIIICNRSVDSPSSDSANNAFSPSMLSDDLDMRVEEGSICSLFGFTRFNHVKNLRDASPDVQTALRWMTEQVGISPNFILKMGDFSKGSTAFATIRNNQRFMVFDAKKRFKTPQGVLDYISLGTLAHELGHHLAGHTALIQLNPHKKELEADKFAGFILGKLGASDKEAVRWAEVLSPYGSVSHPPGHLRVKAAKEGWRQAQLTSAAICRNKWIGNTLDVDGQICRMVHRCNNGIITYELACEQDSGRWLWHQ